MIRHVPGKTNTRADLLSRKDQVNVTSVRSANSKLELSQLLFISIRQRKLVKSSRWIGLSTYTSATWSVHYFPTRPCDVTVFYVTWLHLVSHDVTWLHLVSHDVTDFPTL